MSNQYCQECGHQNPADARYCMNCGTSQTGAPSASAMDRYVPPPPPPGRDTDWATTLGAIVAAVLAFLSLRHASRKARQTTVLLVFLALFFGCPMICGCTMAIMEGFVRLFQ